MAKPNRKKCILNYKQLRFALQIFIISFALSILLSFSSQSALSNSCIFIAFLVLLLIIFIGIIFDVVGVAVATAQAAPFHAMAAKKNPRANIALNMIRRASLVATFSNDVVGDIAGIISGAAVASIAIKIGTLYSAGNTALVNVLLSGIAASLTVAGKALGKDIAIKQSNAIVYIVATIVYDVKYIVTFQWLGHGNK